MLLCQLYRFERNNLTESAVERIHLAIVERWRIIAAVNLGTLV